MPGPSGTNAGDIRANTASVPVLDCAEPLVSIASLAPGVLLDCRSPFLRLSAAERLTAAQNALTIRAPDVRIRVGEAYRDPEHQRTVFRKVRLLVRVLRPFWSSSQVNETAARYAADPDGDVPPPHGTGGAVDVGLVDKMGRRLYMGPFRLRAARIDCTAISRVASANRALLSEAMSAVGFINYPEEWWHWSYGDTEWAVHSGAPAAIYGPIDPPSL